MSLEEALNANTKAILAHNALLEKMMAGSKGAAPATKSAEAPAAKAAPKAAPAAPASKPATKKKAETTAEHVTERVKAFLKGGDEDERAVRKANVKAIIDYYGVDRFTAIDPASFDEALAFLDRFAEGEDPFAEEGEAGSEGEDGDDDGVI